MIEAILLAFSHYWLYFVPALILAYLLRNYFNKGLNKYPGPFLANFTNAWRFIDVYKRRPDITQIRLHRQLGNIVRLGPNTLSFSDPAAIKTIYGLNKGFVKVSRPLDNDTSAYPYLVGILSASTGNVRR